MTVVQVDIDRQPRQIKDCEIDGRSAFQRKTCPISFAAQPSIILSNGIIITHSFDGQFFKEGGA